MSTRMQQRRGTANQWISTNAGNGPILSPGEIGYESDTNKFKIGDGVNHWVDLTYFTDAESITTALNSIIDGAPAALNTLNELAQALGDDANFLANLATESYVDTAVGNIDLSTKQDVVSGVSSTEIGYLDGVTSAIQTQLDAKIESSDIAALATESYVDTAVGNVTVDFSTKAGTNLDWNVTTSQFDVNSSGLLTSPTISSSLTLDGTGDFTVSADANIILDATTEVYLGSAASGNEVATKSYANTAASNAAAAIVDSAPGTLNTLNELAAAINDDASYAATIVTALGNKQDKVTGVSDTEIGYLNGVTSAIQTQIDGVIPEISVNGTTFNSLTSLSTPFRLQMGNNGSYYFRLVTTYNDETQTPNVFTSNDLALFNNSYPVGSIINASGGPSYEPYEFSIRITQPATIKSYGGATVLNSIETVEFELLSGNTISGIDYDFSFGSPNFNNSGKFLTNDGTNVSWGTIDLSSIQTDLQAKLPISEPSVDYYVTNEGMGAYAVNGVSNGTIHFEKGKKYRVIVNAPGHPFWIQTVSGGYSSSDVFATGITNAGTDSGSILVELPQNAPDDLYYACEFHSSMAGSISTKPLIPSLGETTSTISSSSAFSVIPQEVSYAPDLGFMRIQTLGNGSFVQEDADLLTSAFPIGTAVTLVGLLDGYTEFFYLIIQGPFEYQSDTLRVNTSPTDGAVGPKVFTSGVELTGTTTTAGRFLTNDGTSISWALPSSPATSSTLGAVYGSTSSVTDATSLGNDSYVSNQGTSIGADSSSGFQGTSLGRGAITEAYSVAIGSGTYAPGAYSIALGYGASAYNDNQIKIGTNAGDSSEITRFTIPGLDIDWEPATVPSLAAIATAKAEAISEAIISGYSAPTLGSTSIASGATVSSIADLTLTNPTFTGVTKVGQLAESFYNTGTSPSSTASIYLVGMAPVVYYPSAAMSNWTINLLGDGPISFGNLIDTGRSVTIAVLVTNGSTGYYPIGFQIDSMSQTVKWQGGTSPMSGNTNSVDVYSYTILKTGFGTYQVFGSQTKFA